MFTHERCTNFSNCNGTQQKRNDGAVLNKCACCSKAKKRIMESIKTRNRENGK